MDNIYKFAIIKDFTEMEIPFTMEFGVAIFTLAFLHVKIFRMTFSY